MNFPVDMVKLHISANTSYSSFSILTPPIMRFPIEILIHKPLNKFRRLNPKRIANFG